MINLTKQFFKINQNFMVRVSMKDKNNCLDNNFLLINYLLCLKNSQIEENKV